MPSLTAPRARRPAPWTDITWRFIGGDIACGAVRISMLTSLRGDAALRDAWRNSKINYLQASRPELHKMSPLNRHTTRDA
jgi:hypothetical protein